MTFENKGLCDSPGSPAQIVVEGYQGLMFRRWLWRMVKEHLLAPATRLHHYKDVRTGVWRGAQSVVECCRRAGAATRSKKMNQL